MEPPASSAPVLELVGGVAAHNEEATIATAIRSLLVQELRPSVRCRRVWVVVSGSTDRTLDRARAVARQDPRVAVLEEPERLGKWHALNAIFERAEGDRLVLLNGDAVAEPGAVRALLDASAGVEAPFAVMGRPIPPDPPRRTGLTGAIALLWRVHEEMHRETLGDGDGNHLSDELLMLSLPVLAPLPAGAINDGAFLGAWLARRGGALRYAPAARVRIRVPSTAAGYLTQRRRIYAGHAQVFDETGVIPTTWVSLAFRDPRRAWRVLRRSRGAEPLGRWLLLLGALDALALMLAGWDRLPPRRDHGRWTRVTAARGWERASAHESTRT